MCYFDFSGRFSASICLVLNQPACAVRQPIAIADSIHLIKKRRNTVAADTVNDDDDDDGDGWRWRWLGTTGCASYSFS